MVTYFDENTAGNTNVSFTIRMLFSAARVNFKDPADGMDACCEPPAVQDDGFHALLDKTFS